jgi:hypothetical protein
MPVVLSLKIGIALKVRGGILKLFSNMSDAFFSPLCCSILRHSISSSGDVNRLSLSAACFIILELTDNVLFDADRPETFGCIAPGIRFEN